MARNVNCTLVYRSVIYFIVECHHDANISSVTFFDQVKNFFLYTLSVPILAVYYLPLSFVVAS